MHVLFMDFKQAFDVSSEVRIKVSEKLVRLVSTYNNGEFTREHLYKKGTKEGTYVKRGVGQGDNLLATIFNIVLQWSHGSSCLNSGNKITGHRRNWQV